ncbi:cohesin domain-containing protein [Candidatus Gracilibacteria bacterium]|nr:cohesin domain-containing protein [Candidatus Gracilibacteria bacterium]
MKKIIAFCVFVLILFFIENKVFADVIDDTLFEISGESFILENNVNSDVETKNGRIFIEKNFIDDNSFKISVYAEDVFSPVIGVSFHLKYDAKKISFVEYKAGDFLEAGGEPFYLVKNSPEKNKIYFGATLKKGDSFPTQGGKIVDFYFKIPEYTMADQAYADAENSKILFSFSNGNVSAMDNGAEKIKNIKFENSEINLLEKDGFSKRIASVFENFNFSKNKFFFWCLFGMAIFGVVTLALFLAFKYGKKRAVGSVNFK